MSIDESLKKIASPFSTGGGGVIFETRIQASFAVLMLADGYSPCLPQFPIKEIQFIRICEKSGHLNVALSQIGNVLIYVPADDSLWINTSVAEVLNRRDMEKLRQSYSTAIHNSRGIHWVDLTGKPEKELAEKYHRYANAVDDKGFQRFATTLDGIAKDYERQAEEIISKNQEK